MRTKTNEWTIDQERELIDLIRNSKAKKIKEKIADASEKISGNRTYDSCLIKYYKLCKEDKIRLINPEFQDECDKILKLHQELESTSKDKFLMEVAYKNEKLWAEMKSIISKIGFDPRVGVINNRM
jgi:Zn-dependent M32 family carboxypeptidase